MVQIIQAAAPKRNFGGEIGRELAGGLREGYEESKNRRFEQQQLESENESLKKLGIQLSGIRNPKMRELVTAEMLKSGRKEPSSADMKQRQELGNLEGALDSLRRMQELTEEGNLGIGTGFRSLYDPKVAEQSGEYERLGKSLIQYASNIPIRNKAEFETLAHDLYDPSIRDSKRRGILKSMRRIIENSIKSHSLQDDGMESKAEENKERKPLSTFMGK